MGTIWKLLVNYLIRKTAQKETLFWNGFYKIHQPTNPLTTDPLIHRPTKKILFQRLDN